MLNIDDRLLNEVTADELFLMLHIAKYMNVSDNTAFPSISTLCRVTKWSKPSVLKVKKNCIDKNLLSCEKMVNANGGYASNIYTIETEHISLFINAKGRKLTEVVSEIDKGVVKNIDKGSKKNLLGVVKNIDYPLVNNIDPNILVTSLPISYSNKLVSEQVNALAKKENNSVKAKLDVEMPPRSAAPPTVALKDPDQVTQGQGDWSGEPEKKTDDAHRKNEYDFLHNDDELTNYMIESISESHVNSLIMNLEKMGFEKDNLRDYVYAFACKYFETRKVKTQIKDFSSLYKTFKAWLSWIIPDVNKAVSQTKRQNGFNKPQEVTTQKETQRVDTDLSILLKQQAEARKQRLANQNA